MGLRALLVLAIAYVGIYLFLYVSGLVYPFIIALIIAYMINPIVNFLDRKMRFPRSLAVFVTLILVFGAIIGLVFLLVTEGIAAANYLLVILPEKFPQFLSYLQDILVHNIMPLYNDLSMKFSRLGASQQQTITTNIQTLSTSLSQNVKDILTAILAGLTNFLSALPSIATVLIFSLLATFFISNDWHRIGNVCKKIIPQKVHGYGITIFKDLQKALFGYLKAQFTLISMTTLIVLIGYLILRVPYAITVALVTGIVDLLPYLGTGTIFVPWILYSWFTGDTSFALGLLVLFIVVIVQRQLIEPKILSSNIGMDPLATLVALFVGFKLFGFLGLIIGPVTLVLITTLYKANVFHDIWTFIKG
ncbi:sporulation integral membrane protein YtvI [Ectobacillus polymachus]|uniref:sporulation integral membrane protein YtvI n=1 Tax=Ectobacillus polymachus TaxID=1508806 RepID=UPI003A8B2926